MSYVSVEQQRIQELSEELKGLQEKLKTIMDLEEQIAKVRGEIDARLWVPRPTRDPQVKPCYYEPIPPTWGTVWTKKSDSTIRCYRPGLPPGPPTVPVVGTQAWARCPHGSLVRCRSTS